jgi:D-lactate dehydrogenase
MTFPNVLITAHQAFLTHEALVQIAGSTLDNLLRMQSNSSWREGTQL